MSKIINLDFLVLERKSLLKFEIKKTNQVICAQIVLFFFILILILIPNLVLQNSKPPRSFGEIRDSKKMWIVGSFGVKWPYEFRSRFTQFIQKMSWKVFSDRIDMTISELICLAHEKNNNRILDKSTISKISLYCNIFVMSWRKLNYIFLQ